MRRLLLLTGLVAALAWTAQAPGRPACTAGVHTLGGATVRTFCGPAKATLHLGTRTYVFTGGECARAGNKLGINIGTITLGPSPKSRYFGVLVSGATHDGTFTNQIVSWQFPGKGGGLAGAKVTLSGGQTKGTFSGSVIRGGTASGTFTCR